MVKKLRVTYSCPMPETRELALLFGRRFREIRKVAAGTQDRFAELSGLNQQRISRLENGLGWETFCEVYEAISQVGADPRDLFREGTPADPVSVEIQQLLPLVPEQVRRLALELLRLTLQQQSLQKKADKP